ncbi:proton-coupled folate transporter-like [Homarus americanus]|uniref:proton-coupled folate transporter-like n=1 Tax=Homarus americanus TaxID=6706 RepID=UPI001C47C358|nr:proton-coupled folate transporter-like [Homarus americanus]
METSSKFFLTVPKQKLKSSSNETSPLLPKCAGDVGRESTPPSTSSRICGFLSQVTVEPVAFLTAVCLGIEMVFLVNLWVDKTCQYLGYSEHICQQLDSGSFPTEQDAVQRKVNELKNVYGLWIKYIPATFVVIVLGAWSDIRNRRLPIFLSTFGLFLKATGIFLNSFWRSLPPGYILLALVPTGIFGGLMALIQGCSAYISVISSKRSRTFRMAFVNMLMLLGAPAGNAVGTFIYNSYGYNFVFGAEIVIYIVSMLYIVARLEKHPGTDSLRHQPHSSVLKVLSPSSLVKPFSVLFKKREGGARGHILGHVIIIWILLFDTGVMNFDFLYTRKMFGWDHNTFTIWSITKSAISCLGTIVVVPFLSYVKQVNDSVLGFMGAASFMFRNIIAGTAPAPWVLYIAVVAGVFTNFTFSASRGRLSKLVAAEELGAIFAVVAMGESIMPVINGPSLSFIYNATLEVFPGTIYAITGSLFAVICCIYTWLLTRPEQLLAN